MADAEPIQAIAPLPPIPPIPAFVLPLAALPLPPLPPVQQLPTMNPLCNDPQYSHLFDQLHPIEPMPIYPKPKMQRFRSGKRMSNNKHGNVCHTPIREIIPNAVCPATMPKHIADVKFKPRINPNNGNIYPRASKFIISYNLIRIGYSYGANSGYTRENAFMEAGRCLRYLLARDIQLLDKSMGVDADLEDLFEFIDLDDDVVELDNDDDIVQPIQTIHPTINIINSNVTISSQPSRNIVYDNDDNMEFVFEELDAPVDDDDMPILNFDEIVEI